MAEYRIMMVVLPDPAPTGASTGTLSNAPWSNGGAGFTLSAAQVEYLTITDDDDMFDGHYYAKGEDQQLLVEEAVIGSGSHASTVPAGTGISHFLGSVIRDAQGNEFIATFARSASSGGLGTVLGGKTAVFITPVPKPDPITGERVFPSFDPNSTFHFARTHSLTTTDHGIPYAPSPPPAVPCFAAGTMIDTMPGPRAVESLEPGDMVLTRDAGYRPLRWIGGTHVDAAGLDLQPNLRPILIRAGTLAPGVPARPLRVSPQHRILVRSPIARRMFGEDEILVAARHLAGLPGIEVLNPALGVTYYHLLFDGHQIVRSDGAWSESLFTGPQAMRAVGEEARAEIFALFPELADPGFRPLGARRLLNGREGRQLARRHAKNGRALVGTA